MIKNLFKEKLLSKQIALIFYKIFISSQAKYFKNKLPKHSFTSSIISKNADFSIFRNFDSFHFFSIFFLFRDSQDVESDTSLL